MIFNQIESQWCNEDNIIFSFLYRVQTISIGNTVYAKNNQL